MARDQKGVMNNYWLHGETEGRKASPEYKSWQSAKDRCYNPNNNRFKDYGDKGIKMCERWLNDFETFLKDMGRKPSKKHTLGRKDNDGDYTPENCEWQTVSKQNRNRSITKVTWVEIREIRMLWDKGYNQRDLAKEFHVSRSYISLIVNEKRWKEGKE